MALGATIFRITVGLSDVDRGVYETLELRMAQHPSESLRYFVTRLLAYALSYEEGIQFSKGGISDTDEPPIAIRDPTGIFLAWIDVGAPAAERIHKAAKAARRVAIYTTSELTALRERAAEIHHADRIEVVTLPLVLTDAIETQLDRTTALELARTDGHLYLTLGGTTIDAPLKSGMLAG